MDNAKETGSRSKLSEPVKAVIKMMFDVQTMKATMQEFEVYSLDEPYCDSLLERYMHLQIDLDQMPLGKLSKRHLQNAYQILTELQNVCLF